MASHKKKALYRLAFVEFDDQGQFQKPEQLNTMLNEYQKIAGTNDILLVTFVHGWHHSAQPGDGNIASFRRLLSHISEVEGYTSAQQGREPRKILGVYIGWRGDSLAIPYLNTITFWDRKSTAHKVGQQGVTETLVKLEEIVNVKKGIDEADSAHNSSRMVLIGHSFGGAVIYSSIQNILVDRFVDSRQGKTYQGNANGFGDLVVLVNPAFEALRFSTLYNLSQEYCRDYFRNQVPKLAILTSETDFATRYAFPAGRFFSTFFEAHGKLDRHYCLAPGSKGIDPMRISEGEADRTAVGHFDSYLTHTLSPAPVSTTLEKSFRLKNVQTLWATQNYAASLDFDGSRLKSLGRTSPRNPYLNIKVDKQFMDGHNDIWGKEVESFIRDLIIISTTPSSQTK